MPDCPFNPSDSPCDLELDLMILREAERESLEIVYPMDSCWAREPETLTINSVVSVLVSIFSFSNWTDTPRRDSSRRAARQSLVFRAKREMDLTITLSILPFRQSAIIRLKSSRLSIRVPVRPSSANVKQGLIENCKQIVNLVERNHRL